MKKRNHQPQYFTCLNCGVVFRFNRPRKYCSRECAFKHKVGTLASAYKDGQSLNRERARAGNELAKWRKAVFKRDDYTCRQCGGKGIIHAHHLKTFSEYPELRFDVDNGVTLCLTCHGKEHGKDFTNRRNKVCPDCGNATSGQGSGLCHSCATRHQWHQKREQLAFL